MTSIQQCSVLIITMILVHIKEDVVRFINNDNKLEIWSRIYFTDLIKKLKFTNLPDGELKC